MEISAGRRKTDSGNGCFAATEISARTPINKVDDAKFGSKNAAKILALSHN